MRRYARVSLRGPDTVDTVRAYLPSNYKADEFETGILIYGEDNAGWTLDGYVIPRLASGLIHAREINGDPR